MAGRMSYKARHRAAHSKVASISSGICVGRGASADL